MNRILVTFFLLISNVFAQGQDGYLRFHNDSEYRNQTVKVFKGEIFPFINASKSNRINVIIDTDTITDLPVNSKTFEITPSPNTIYDSRKAEYLQVRNGGMVWLNAAGILDADTVTLMSESGQQIIQLIDKREAQVHQSNLGKICRLIISNAPTIFYRTDNLKRFVEPASIKKEYKMEIQNTKKLESGWALWKTVLLIILGFGVIASSAWFFIIKRRNSNLEPKFVTYNGNSLKDFAIENGITLSKLIKYNKRVIDKKYEHYEEKERKQIRRDIKGKSLIVGYHSKVIQTDTSKSPLKEFVKMNESQINNEWDSQRQNNYPPTDFDKNNNGLSSQLRQMESTLIREIQKLSSNNTNQNEIHRLRNEKSEVENKIRALETDKKNADSKVLQMQSDKSMLESKLQNVADEMGRMQNEIISLKEKFISIDFLKGNSEALFSYLKYCQMVSSDAYSFFNRISQQNPKQAFAAGYLLMKFQSTVNSIPVGDWMRTVQDIKDSGATTNKQLTRSFSQIQNESDKQREFQRLIFSEVLIKYTSNILILAEAFRNISRFQGSTDLVNEAQSTFEKHVVELLSKAKSVGLGIKYVRLFENWEKYLGQVEDNGGERSLAYKEINGLEKGAITEIVSYGVKTSLGDDTKTIIILA